MNALLETKVFKDLEWMHDVANQMWSEAKLGHLLFLDPFRMLGTWHAWTLIMIKWLGLALRRLKPWLWLFGICLKWLGLTLGRHAACEFLAFDVAHVFMHLWWAQVLGLDSFKKQFWASFQVEFNHRLLGLSSLTTYKVQTIIIGSSVGLESSWFKQRPNKRVMKCNLHGPT